MATPSFVFVREGAPLSSASLVSLGEASALLGELHDEPLSTQRALGRVVARIRDEGLRVVWAFGALGDAGSLLVGDHEEPRVMGPPREAILVEGATVLWQDERFVQPGAGSLQPRLLPAARRRWSEAAVYRRPQQLIVAPGDRDERARFSSSSVAAILDRRGPYWRRDLRRVLADDDAAWLDAVPLDRK
jgi:hypothetical protein